MSELSEQQVVDFLSANQNFLQNHPELLTQLSIYHEPTGTTSLVRRQQSLLQNKNSELTNKLSSLVEIATNNEHIFKVFNQCYRCLLECDTLPELNSKLSQIVCKGFHLKACRLHAFNQQLHNNLITDKLAEQVCFLGRLNPNEQQLLFGQQVASAAVYLVGPRQNPQAILAFASNDEAHYHPEKSSLFVLEFIKALEIKLAQL